jgi:hypothetical protein
VTQPGSTKLASSDGVRGTGSTLYRADCKANRTPQRKGARVKYFAVREHRRDWKALSTVALWEQAARRHGGPSKVGTLSPRLKQGGVRWIFVILSSRAATGVVTPRGYYSVFSS